MRSRLQQVHPGGSLRARPYAWPAAAWQLGNRSVTPGSRAQVVVPDTAGRCGTSARSLLLTPEATCVRYRARTRRRTPRFSTSTWSVSHLSAARTEEMCEMVSRNLSHVVSMPSRLSPEHSRLSLTCRGWTSCCPDLQ